MYDIQATRRVFKQKAKQERRELHEIDSEFSPTRLQVEEDETTETLTKIDNILEETS